MDPSTRRHQEMGNPSKGQKPQPEEALKCPRCESTNTKFCYYNNYSLSQPRYFCKSCRRYWTKGGTLRNVPVGGGCRKTKRSSPSSKRTQDQTLTPNTNPIVPPLSYDAGHLSILGNPSLNVAGSVANPAFRGNFNNFRGFGYEGFWEAVDNGGPTVGFNGETMIPYNIEDMIDSTTTSDVAVTMMKQDSTGNRSVLWGLPWQLIPDAAGNNNNNDNMVVGTDLDSVRGNWHGLLNSLLM